MRKNILIPAIIGGVAFSAILASADGDAPHRFISFDGVTWTDLSKISEITFKKDLRTESFVTPEGDDTYDVNWHSSTITLKSEGGEEYKTEVTQSLAAAEFENVLEMPSGKLHPVFHYADDDYIRIYLSNTEAPDEGYMDSYPQELISPYFNCELLGMMREGTSFHVDARCEFCHPVVGVYGQNGALGYEDNVFTMGYEPVRVIANHEAVCLHKYFQIWNQLAQRLYADCTRYSGLFNGVYFGNGETGVMTLYGEMLSQDNYNSLRTLLTGGNNTWFTRQFDMHNGVLSDAAWHRYYDLIGYDPRKIQIDLNGDGKLDAEDNVTSYGYVGDCTINTMLYLQDDLREKYPSQVEDLDQVKAQLLTARANIYSRLLQIYAPRWEDSADGSALCLPIMQLPDGLKKTQSSVSPELYLAGHHDYNSPLLSMREIRDYIYQDIDMAVQLFNKENKSSLRSEKWLPDANVALGIKARTALFTHDWQVALESATKAVDSYSIMKADEYLQGFVNPTSETMWSEFNTLAYAPSDLGYYGFGAAYAVNGPYPNVWGYCPGAINVELFNRMEANDIRRKCFVMPEIMCDEDGSMNVEEVRHFVWNFTNPDTGIIAGTNAVEAVKQHLESCRLSIPFPDVPQVDARTPLMIGMQTKFWGKDHYGTSSFPLMRASEMVLTRAEAALELGNFAEAVEAVNQIRINRGLEPLMMAISQADLRKEIQLQRRIELWGEGHNWFDFKRWNLPIKQKVFDRMLRDGNIPANAALDIPADSINGWKLPIPQWEIKRNAAISESGK